VSLDLPSVLGALGSAERAATLRNMFRAVLD